MESINVAGVLQEAGNADSRVPALDPKCKFNVSSFLTLPHLPDCLISTRNYMSNLLLLQMMVVVGVGGGGVDLEQGVGIIL